jgi:hypothetical protein
MSSFITSTSPVCSPARISRSSERTASRADIAARIARAGPSKVARKPSPIVSSSRPRWRLIAKMTLANGAA